MIRDFDNSSPARSKSGLTGEGRESRENMTPDSESNLRLEIGHVLFIDSVDYSKLQAVLEKVGLDK
jgi:hypothetical protein